jgi:hypothetical protein
VAARECFVGLVVVFDVVGAEALASVPDVHVVIGDEEIALAALGAFGGELGDAALGRGWVGLLRICRRRAEEKTGKKKPRDSQKKQERGKFPAMRVAIHADDVANRMNSIA